MFKEKEKTLRIYTQKQLAETVKNKKAVENKLIVTVRSKEILQGELSAEKEKSLTLEKEVKEKEHQIKLTLDKLQKEITVRREAEARLIMAMKERRILETKLREFTERPKTVALEKIVVKTAPGLAGKVVMANKEHGFIVVNLGRADNLGLGDILSVYRNGEFIGRAQIEKIEEKVSAAAILPEWQGAEFKENDEVRQT